MSGEAGGGEAATGEVDVASAGGRGFDLASVGLKGHRARGGDDGFFARFFEVGNSEGGAEVTGPFRHFRDVLIGGDYFDFGVEGPVEPVFVNESGAGGSGDSKGTVQDAGLAGDGGEGSGADDFVAALTEVGGENPNREEGGLRSDLMNDSRDGGAVSSRVVGFAFFDLQVVVDFELGENFGLGKGGVSAVQAGVENGDDARRG